MPNSNNLLLHLHRLTGLEELSDPAGLANAEVETQVHTSEGIPDIRITTPDVLVIVEVKVEAVLAEDQAESYLRLLESASDATEARRLVLLTRYPAPSSVPDQVHQVRWFQIADALKTLADEGLAEPTRYLVGQFLGFLSERGMTVARAQAGVGDALHRYQEARGDDSLFLNR